MFRQLPPITQKLLWANILVFLFEYVGNTVYGPYWLQAWFGLHNIAFSAFHGAGSFHIWQPFTYMFLHSGFSHMFWNMFALLMFGPAIEEEWGEKKYLTYYLVCGVGAAVVQQLMWFVFRGAYPAVTIGASGAIFGILLAMGWLFPDGRIYLYFIIPMRTRTFVLLYALFELFFGIAGVADGVAHFAHLGGMLFGALLIYYWNHGGDRFRFTHKKEDDDDRFSNYHYQSPIR